MATRTPGLTLGPEDVDQAGELVRELGVHNRAHMLLNRHAQLYPMELVQALSLPRDAERSDALDMEEVEGALKDVQGRRAFFRDGFVLEDASVKGDRPDNRVVAVVFTNPETGRTGRGVIPYETVEGPTERRAQEKARERMTSRLAGEEGTTLPTPAASPETRDKALLDRLETLEREFRSVSAERDELHERLGDSEPSNQEPFDGYDEMSADELNKRLKADGASEYGRAGLERMETYEAEHKNRSTVLSTIQELQSEVR